MSELVIRHIGESIAIFSVPFSRLNLIPFGGRSTAIKLGPAAGGGVLVVASSPCDAATRETIDKMGSVSHLITPDYVHALYISDFHKAYPEAKCIGPEGIDSKKPDVKWAGVLGAGGEDKTYGFEEEVKLVYIPEHTNKEIAVIHKPTKTLVVADLLFNMPCDEQYSKTSKSSNMIWPLNGLFQSWRPGSSLNDRLQAGLYRDKASLAKKVKEVASYDFDRIIMCHGDVIETGGKQAWNDNYRWAPKD